LTIDIIIKHSFVMNYLLINMTIFIHINPEIRILYQILIEIGRNKLLVIVIKKIKKKIKKNIHIYIYINTVILITFFIL